MNTTAQQKYDALLFWEGCNSRTHLRSVAVLCTAGVGVIAALASAPYMIAAKRRVRGASGLSAKCLSSMTKLGSINECQPRRPCRVVRR